MLEIKDLKKHFGKVKAVGGISFHVEKGEIVGFIGPNGSGKSTTLKMIMSLIRPDRGRIFIGGYDLMKSRKKALSHMAGIVGAPGLYANLSGIENLKFIQRMRKVSSARLKECVELTGLGDHLKRRVHKYSLGMRQRLALGMALLTKPELLILDEPTKGLDPAGATELREILKAMSATEGTSILFSSHQLGEVEKLARRAVYIKEGLLIQEPDHRRPGMEYLLRVSDSRKAAALLQTLPHVASVGICRDGRLKVRYRGGAVGHIPSRLGSVAILDIERCAYDLESLYKELYGAGADGGARV